MKDSWKKDEGKTKDATPRVIWKIDCFRSVVRTRAIK